MNSLLFLKNSEEVRRHAHTKSHFPPSPELTILNAQREKGDEGEGTKQPAKSGICLVFFKLLNLGSLLNLFYLLPNNRQPSKTTPVSQVNMQVVVSKNRQLLHPRICGLQKEFHTGSQKKQIARDL